MKTLREARVGAAGVLDDAHKAYMEARANYDRAKGVVDRMNSRLEDLHEALQKLGGSDDG